MRLDVDVQQGTRPGVLLATDNPPGGAVEPAQALQAEAAEHPIDRRGGESEPVADAGRPELLPPSQPLDAAFQALRSAAELRCGRQERSRRLASPSASQRRHQREAVWRATPISAATWAAGLPWAIRSTSRRRPAGVSFALACNEDLLDFG